VTADAYDRRMIGHAAARGPVHVLYPTPHGTRTEPATLLAWRLGTEARPRRMAVVQFARGGATRTVRQADVMLPDEPEGMSHPLGRLAGKSEARSTDLGSTSNGLLEHTEGAP